MSPCALMAAVMTFIRQAEVCHGTAHGLQPVGDVLETIPSGQTRFTYNVGHQDVAAAR